MLKDQSDLVEVRLQRGQRVALQFRRVLALLNHVYGLVLVVGARLAEVVELDVALMQVDVLHAELVVQQLLTGQLLVGRQDALEQAQTRLRLHRAAAQELLQVLLEVLVD